MKKFFNLIIVLSIVLAGSLSSVNAQVVVKVKPNRPNKVAVVKPKAPGKGHVWIDGHWKWNAKQNKYVWRKGHWVKKKRGHRWVAGHWVNAPKGHKWVPGHWARA